MLIMEQRAHEKDTTHSIWHSIAKSAHLLNTTFYFIRDCGCSWKGFYICPQKSIHAHLLYTVNCPLSCAIQLSWQQYIGLVIAQQVLREQKGWDRGGGWGH